MKQLLITLIASLAFFSVYAQDETSTINYGNQEIGDNALFVYVNGDSTCYMLDQYPKVVFSNGTAYLYVSDQTLPVLTFKPQSNSDLKLVTGIYKDPTSIENIEDRPTVVEQRGKYIIGRKLVIIKNGRKYDANGIEIK